MSLAELPITGINWHVGVAVLLLCVATDVSTDSWRRRILKGAAMGGALTLLGFHTVVWS